MATEQTVDWASGEMRDVLRRRHRHLLGMKPMSAAALAVLFGVGLLQLWLMRQPWTLMLAALLLVGLFALGRVELRRSLRVATASGLTHCRLEEDDLTLYVRNDLGEFRLPFAQFDRLIRLPGRIVINYGGGSQMNLPEGPVASELQRRFPFPASPFREKGK